MATWLPVRAFNRTQEIRIGKQKVTSVDSVGALANHVYIDLEDKVSRKELAYHTSIGGVYAAGTEIEVVAGTAVGHGARVTVTTLNGGSTDPAAVIYVTNTAVLGVSGVTPVYTVDGSYNVTKPSGTWTTGYYADILVQIHSTTGVVSTKTGTAVNTGTQVTPSVDASNLAVAKFTLTYGASNHTASAVTNLKY